MKAGTGSGSGSGSGSYAIPFDLRAWSKQLRQTADAIDRLFEQPGSARAAAQIRGTLVAPTNGNGHGNGSYGSGSNGQGHRTPGTPHWTQKPENYARMVAIAKARRAAQLARTAPVSFLC